MDIVEFKRFIKTLNNLDFRNDVIKFADENGYVVRERSFDKEGLLTLDFITNIRYNLRSNTYCEMDHYEIMSFHFKYYIPEFRRYKDAELYGKYHSRCTCAPGYIPTPQKRELLEYKPEERGKVFFRLDSDDLNSDLNEV